MGHFDLAFKNPGGSVRTFEIFWNNEELGKMFRYIASHRNFLFEANTISRLLSARELFQSFRLRLPFFSGSFYVLGLPPFLYNLHNTLINGTMKVPYAPFNIPIEHALPTRWLDGYRLSNLKGQ